MSDLNNSSDKGFIVTPSSVNNNDQNELDGEKTLKKKKAPSSPLDSSNIAESAAGITSPNAAANIINSTNITATSTFTNVSNVDGNASTSPNADITIIDLSNSTPPTNNITTPQYAATSTTTSKSKKAHKTITHFFSKATTKSNVASITNNGIGGTITTTTTNNNNNASHNALSGNVLSASANAAASNNTASTDANSDSRASSNVAFTIINNHTGATITTTTKNNNASSNALSGNVSAASASANVVASNNTASTDANSDSHAPRACVNANNNNNPSQAANDSNSRGGRESKCDPVKYNEVLTKLKKDKIVDKFTKNRIFCKLCGGKPIKTRKDYYLYYWHEEHERTDKHVRELINHNNRKRMAEADPSQPQDPFLAQSVLQGYFIKKQKVSTDEAVVVNNNNDDNNTASATHATATNAVQAAPQSTTEKSTKKKKQPKICMGVMDRHKIKSLQLYMNSWKRYLALPKDLVIRGEEGNYNFYAEVCSKGQPQFYLGQQRCNNCVTMRKMRTKYCRLKNNLEKRYDLFLQLKRIIALDSVTDADADEVDAFIRNTNILLTDYGEVIKEEVKELYDFYKCMKKLNKDKEIEKILTITKKNDDGTVTKSMPKEKEFLKAFIEVTESEHSEVLTNSIAYALIKSLLAKIKGWHNVPYGDTLRNFIVALYAITPKGADFVSGNLHLHHSRTIKYYNAKDRSVPILHYNKVLNHQRIREWWESVKPEGDDEPLVLGSSFDAVKIPELVQILATMGRMVGFAFPNQFLTLPKCDKELNGLLKGERTTYTDENGEVVHLTRATEIKVCVITAQKVKTGHCPFTIMCGHAQTTNAVSNFNEEMVEHIESFCHSLNEEYNNNNNNINNNDNRSETGNTRSSNPKIKAMLVSAANDGVSSDQEFVQQGLIKYLSGDSNVATQTDTNHNAKNIRGQIVAGAELIILGDYVIDRGLPVIAEVNHDLIKVVDYASDLSVLKFASEKTVEKISEKRETENNGNISLYCMTLFMLRLNLAAVNSKNMFYSLRVRYLWMSLVWFTSMKGIHSTTKRNLATAVIPLCFLTMMKCVTKVRLLTEEPSEHLFGNMRSCQREFTAKDMVHMADKTMRFVKAVYKSGLSVSRDRGKGYTACFGNFVSSTTSGNRKEIMKEDGGGIVEVKNNSKYSYAQQIWNEGTLLFNIEEANDEMRHVLAVFGVKEEEMSPFLKPFKELKELLEVYKSVLKRGSGKVDEATLKKLDLAAKKENEEALRRHLVQQCLSVVDYAESGKNNNSNDDDFDYDFGYEGNIFNNSNNFYTNADATTAVEDEKVVGAVNINNLDVKTAVAAVFDMCKGDRDVALTDLPIPIYNAMSLLHLKGRDVGSTRIDTKGMSLKARYYTKSNTGNSEGNNNNINNEEIYLTRNTIVVLKIGNKCVPYRLLVVLERYNNRFYPMSPKKTPPKWEGVKTKDLSNYRLQVSQLKMDNMNNKEVYLPVELSDVKDAEARKEVNKRIELKEIIRIDGNLDIIKEKTE